jgi:hypothetical protein
LTVFSRVSILVNTPFARKPLKSSSNWHARLVAPKYQGWLA